jgi:hypothetical protein
MFFLILNDYCITARRYDGNGNVEIKLVGMKFHQQWRSCRQKPPITYDRNFLQTSL